MNGLWLHPDRKCMRKCLSISIFVREQHIKNRHGFGQFHNHVIFSSLLNVILVGIHEFERIIIHYSSTWSRYPTCIRWVWRNRARNRNGLWLKIKTMHDKRVVYDRNCHFSHYTRQTFGSRLENENKNNVEMYILYANGRWMFILLDDSKGWYRIHRETTAAKPIALTMSSTCHESNVLINIQSGIASKWLQIEITEKTTSSWFTLSAEDFPFGW